MIEVEVLYADLSRKTVPLDQLDILLKSEVLAIVVRTDEETGKLRNIAFSHGFAKYALCQKQDGGQPWIMLFGWDDGDFKWRRLSNSHDIDALREVPMPIGCLHVIFEGQSVPRSKWTTALQVLNDEML
jgi:hypothetical protein